MIHGKVFMKYKVKEIKLQNNVYNIFLNLKICSKYLLDAKKKYRRSISNGYFYLSVGNSDFLLYLFGSLFMLNFQLACYFCFLKKKKSKNWREQSEQCDMQRGRSTQAEYTDGADECGWEPVRGSGGQFYRNVRHGEMDFTVPWGHCEGE